MDFGKLPHVNHLGHVRFDLPPEDPRNAAVLGAGGRVPQPRICVGGPVWACRNWIGKLYPQGTPPRGYLPAYSRQFNAIELNSSFYRVPARAQIEEWKGAVPPDFVFAPKLHQGISHFEDFAAAKSGLKSFWENIGDFGPQLGICFLQLPPHFGFQSWGMLQQLLGQVPDHRKLAVEFRHPSWFAQRMIRPEVFQFLHRNQIATVITDVAGRRDVLHGSLTTRKAFIRFSGNELHPTDYERIDMWVDRISSWIERGIEEVYFFAHQPTETEIPELCLRFTEKLNQRCGLSVRSWSPLQGPAPDPQMTMF